MDLSSLIESLSVIPTPLRDCSSPASTASSVNSFDEAVHTVMKGGSGLPPFAPLPTLIGGMKSPLHEDSLTISCSNLTGVKRRAEWSPEPLEPVQVKKPHELNAFMLALLAEESKATPAPSLIDLLASPGVPSPHPVVKALLSPRTSSYASLPPRPPVRHAGRRRNRMGAPKRRMHPASKVKQEKLEHTSGAYTNKSGRFEWRLTQARREAARVADEKRWLVFAETATQMPLNNGSCMRKMTRLGAEEARTAGLDVIADALADAVGRNVYKSNAAGRSRRMLVAIIKDVREGVFPTDYTRFYKPNRQPTDAAPSMWRKTSHKSVANVVAGGPDESMDESHVVVGSGQPAQPGGLTSSFGDDGKIQRVPTQPSGAAPLKGRSTMAKLRLKSSMSMSHFSVSSRMSTPSPTLRAA